MSDVARMRYIQRQPIEIILKSNRGTQIGNVDGHKRFELEKEIVARKDEDLLLYLKKAFIPFSFYCISSNQNNNRFQYTELQTTGATSGVTLTIEDGNYSITELLTLIQTRMDSSSVIAGFNFKYTCTYNVNTNKVSFLIASGTNPNKTTLNFNTGIFSSDSIRRVLGFSDADVDFTTSAIATSDLLVDVADGLDSLHLKSNLVGDNIQSTVGSINGGELLIIPVDLSPFSILYYSEDANPFKHKLSVNSIKQIELKFTDNNDNTVDFNSIPYTLILVAEFIFNPDNQITTKNKGLLSIEDKITNNEINNKQLFNMLMNKKE